MKYIISTTALALAITAGIVFAPKSHAVTAAPSPNTGQALEIAPPLLNLIGNPGDKIETKIDIRDISPTSLIVSSDVNDFTANGEDGVPKITLDQTEASPYSLKSWISPLGKLTLKPKQIQTMPVTIVVPKNAAPGGYYGVVRFTATAPSIDSSGVSLSASLGTLIFLRINGTANENLAIQDFYSSNNGSRSSLLESAPVDFLIRIKNTGNVYERPTGQILVSDMFGHTVANVNVNLEQRAVLPGSTRKFDAPLDKGVLGDRVLFGGYTAKLVLNYGDKKIVTQSTSFWVIPWRLVLGVILGVVVLAVLGRLALIRYNERLLGNRGRSRRR